MSGVDALVAIRSEFPEARVIIILLIRILSPAVRWPKELVHMCSKSAHPPDLTETIRQVHIQ